MTAKRKALRQRENCGHLFRSPGWSMLTDELTTRPETHLEWEESDTRRRGSLANWSSVVAGDRPVPRSSRHPTSSPRRHVCRMNAAADMQQRIVQKGLLSCR